MHCTTNTPYHVLTTHILKTVALAQVLAVLVNNVRVDGQCRPNRCIWVLSRAESSWRKEDGHQDIAVQHRILVWALRARDRVHQANQAGHGRTYLMAEAIGIACDQGHLITVVNGSWPFTRWPGRQGERSSSEGEHRPLKTLFSRGTIASWRLFVISLHPPLFAIPATGFEGPAEPIPFTFALILVAEGNLEPLYIGPRWTS